MITAERSSQPTEKVIVAALAGPAPPAASPSDSSGTHTRAVQGSQLPACTCCWTAKSATSPFAPAVVYPSDSTVPSACVMLHSSVPSGAVPRPTMPIGPAGRRSPSPGAVMTTEEDAPEPLAPPAAAADPVDVDGDADDDDALVLDEAGAALLVAADGEVVAPAGSVSTFAWPQAATSATAARATAAREPGRASFTKACMPRSYRTAAGAGAPPRRAAAARPATVPRVSPSPAADPACLFCRIVAGEVPATVVRRTERVVAFRDVDPQAPLHVLVVPVDHHRDVPALAAADPALLAEVTTTAAGVAADLGDGQFRLVFNTGAGAGQSVFHVHAHVLGGRPMGWPPG